MADFATNPRARFDYEILETFEAGIMLTGQEVKSIRKGSAKLEGAFVIIRGSEPYLTNVHIPPFQVKNAPKNYDSERPRKLLLSKKEIARIEQETEIGRSTAVPLRIYDKKGKIKVEVAIGRGKKKHDKRESIKERDTKREIDRTLKSQY